MLDYETREKMKKVYRPIMDDDALPIDCRVHAAVQIMRAWYARSCEAYYTGLPDKNCIYEHGIGHPPFYVYISMLLNQGLKSLQFNRDVYDELVSKYGTREGIAGGTYFSKKEK